MLSIGIGTRSRHAEPDHSKRRQAISKGGADPFLGFLKSIFWLHRLPTVREGALAAYWTIQLATQLRVSGVAMGIDIFTLEKSDTKWAARKLDDNEMAEHDAFIASCTDALRGVSGASLANLQPKKIFVSLNLDYLAYWSR